jgi:hypothetical protein
MKNTARAGGAAIFLAASGAADTATANCVAQGSARRTQNRDFDRRGLFVNIDDQIIQSVLRKRKGEVFAKGAGGIFVGAKNRAR